MDSKFGDLITLCEELEKSNLTDDQRLIIVRIFLNNHNNCKKEHADEQEVFLNIGKVIECEDVHISFAGLIAHAFIIFFKTLESEVSSRKEKWMESCSTTFDVLQKKLQA